MSALCFQACVNVGSSLAILGDCLGKEQDWEEATRVTRDALDHLALLVDHKDALVVQARLNLLRFERITELSDLLGVRDSRAEVRFHDIMREAMPLLKEKRLEEADVLMRKALLTVPGISGWHEDKAVLSGIALAAASMIKLGAVSDALELFQQLREPVGRAFGEQSILYRSICESIQVM